MAESFFDPDRYQWREVTGEPELSYKVHHDYTILGYDLAAGTLDMLVRWGNDGGHFTPRAALLPRAEGTAERGRRRPGASGEPVFARCAVVDARGAHAQRDDRRAFAISLRDRARSKGRKRPYGPARARTGQTRDDVYAPEG